MILKKIDLCLPVIIIKKCSKISQFFRSYFNSVDIAKLFRFRSVHMAFTLAEVLITLGIIGVIASLTIPTVIAKQQEKATVVALKKSYSILLNAYNIAVQENGTPDTWSLIAEGSGEGAANLINAIAPYLKIIKNCGNSTGCINPDIYYKNLTKIKSSTPADSSTNTARALLADGTLLLVWINEASCNKVTGTGTLENNCADLYVDINGSKGPNTKGIDYFAFRLNKFGIIPYGSEFESSGSDFSKACNNLSTGSNNGVGCSAWVIFNQNLDYLKCDDLSWGNKTSCD